MEDSNNLRKSYEKAEFISEYLSLWQDYNKLVASGNNLIWIVRNYKVDEKYIVDATNNILDRFCNKYGFNFKCEDWKYAFIILNNACISMMRLGANKVGKEVIKELLKCN